MTATSRLTRSETQPRRGLRRDEAAAYTKNTDWEVYDVYPNANNGEG